MAYTAPRRVAALRFQGVIVTPSCLAFEERMDGAAELPLANPRWLASLVNALAYRERKLLESYEKTLATGTEG